MERYAKEGKWEAGHYWRGTVGCIDEGKRGKGRFWPKEWITHPRDMTAKYHGGDVEVRNKWKAVFR